MSIVTFWNNGKEQTGKTLSLAAICTYLAIEHNYKILVISTGYQDQNLDNCFWEQKAKEKVKKNLGLFGPNTSVALEEGISGLIKMMKSNKLSPNQITNYTKIILKDRLEILPTFKGDKSEYNDVRTYYPEIINLANSYYDLVFVDLDKQVQDDIEETILTNSNLIVASLSQRLTSIDAFRKLREERTILKSRKVLLLIGRYDKFSKYNIKNVSRYLGEKNKVSTIPYNTLFFEACEEARVPDLFLNLKRTGEDDRTNFFLGEVKRTVDNIIYRLEDLR